MVHNCGGHVPNDPMAGKRIGHTFSKHGSHNTDELKMYARGSGIPQRQFLDDIKAEQFIADRLGQLKNGAKTFDAPSGLGRIIHPDGTFTDAKYIRLVPSKSGVSSAYPIYQ